MNERTPDGTELAFFAALTEADAGALDGLLAEEFVLVDVMTGSEIPKDALVEVVRSGLLRFETIDRLEYRVRLYGHVAVIVGRTSMRGRYDGQPFEASSRYTHVLVDDGGRWRMVAAQGTQIASEPETTERA